MIEMEVRFPRHVAQEFEVQDGSSELGRGGDGGTQASVRFLKGKKGESLPRADALAARDDRRARKEEGKGGREGEGTARVLMYEWLIRILVVRSITGSPDAPHLHVW